MPPSLKGRDARDSYTKLPLLMMMTCASYAHNDGHKKQEAKPTKFNSLYWRRRWRFYRHISSRDRTYNGCKGQQQRQPDCQNATSHGSPHLVQINRTISGPSCRASTYTPISCIKVRIIADSGISATNRPTKL